MTHWSMMSNVTIDPGRGDEMTGMRELTAVPTEDGPCRGKPERGLLLELTGGLFPMNDCLKGLDTFRPGTLVERDSFLQRRGE